MHTRVHIRDIYKNKKKQAQPIIPSIELGGSLPSSVRCSCCCLARAHSGSGCQLQILGLPRSRSSFLNNR